MKPLLIIKAGHTWSRVIERFGDFDELVGRGLGLDDPHVRTCAACDGDLLPDPGACCGAIVTGSHNMVTDREPWSVAIEEWVRKAVDREVPLLGICYGHQLMADALGGEAGYHPGGIETGTVTVERLPEAGNDPLLSGMPDTFPAHVTHAQSALRLPPGTAILARNAYEPHHAFRIGPCAWGVQFHPEFNREIIGIYIDELADKLSEAGRDLDRLRADTAETPDASALLARFAQIARAGDSR